METEKLPTTQAPIQPPQTMVTVGRKGTDFVIMVLQREKPMNGIQLTEEDAKIVRNNLCLHLGNPSKEELEELY